MHDRELRMETKTSLCYFLTVLFYFFFNLLLRNRKIPKTHNETIVANYNKRRATATSLRDHKNSASVSSWTDMEGTSR